MTRFEKMIKIRLRVSLAIILMGCLSLAALFYLVWSGFQFASGWVISFDAGIGGGMIGAGIAKALKYRRLLSRREEMEAARIQENDERSVFIRDKTMLVSGLLLALLLYLGTVITGFWNPVVSITLLAVLITFLAISAAVSIILNKKY